MVQCVWPRGSLLSLILFLSRSSFSPESLSELPVRRVRSSCFDNHALLCLSTNVRFLQQKKKQKNKNTTFTFHTPDLTGQAVRSRRKWIRAALLPRTKQPGWGKLASGVREPSPRRPHKASSRSAWVSLRAHSRNPGSWVSAGTGEVAAGSLGNCTRSPSALCLL